MQFEELKQKQADKSLSFKILCLNFLRTNYILNYIFQFRIIYEKKSLLMHRHVKTFEQKIYYKLQKKLFTIGVSCVNTLVAKTHRPVNTRSSLIDRPPVIVISSEKYEFLSEIQLNVSSKMREPIIGNLWVSVWFWMFSRSLCG